MLPQEKNSRSTGMSLLEVIIALTIFASLVLAASMTLVSGMAHRRESFQRYLAVNALRDRLADIQETVNLPENLPQGEGIGAVYSKYDSKNFLAADLPSGQVSVTCFANETLVPVALGGPQDLNFDGDAQDNLGNQANGTDLRLIPLTLTVTYTEDGIIRTMTKHRLIARSTD